MRAIAVFGAANDAIDDAYRTAARRAGVLIAEAGFHLVFGAGSTGLMGEVARGARSGGAKIFGMVPTHLNTPEAIDQQCDELLVTADLRERMTAMERRSDGFLVLPGGLGTLYEAMEILVLLQLGQTKKPLVFLNTLGAYDALNAVIDDAIARGFVLPEARKLCDVCATPQEALATLQARMGQNA